MAKKNVTMGLGVLRRVLGEIGNNITITRGSDYMKKPTSMLTKKPFVQEKVSLPEKVQEVEPMECCEKETMSEEKKTAFFWLRNNVKDIDENDGENPLLVSEYTKEIHEYLRSLEVKYDSIQKDFLENQEVTPKMRSMLVDWLVTVHQGWNFLPETLYMTVTIIDRFLQACEDFFQEIYWSPELGLKLYRLEKSITSHVFARLEYFDLKIFKV